VLRPGGGGAARRHRTVADAQRRAAARAIGGGTQDHLKTSTTGNETALNFEALAVRVVLQPRQASGRGALAPDEVYRQRDPTGRRLRARNRYTELRIQLKPTDG
jgi:hypothetical protein